MLSFKSTIVLLCNIKKSFFTYTIFLSLTVSWILLCPQYWNWSFSFDMGDLSTKKNIFNIDSEPNWWNNPKKINLDEGIFLCYGKICF